jgi:hypothetical protein
MALRSALRHLTLPARAVAELGGSPAALTARRSEPVEPEIGQLECFVNFATILAESGQELGPIWRRGDLGSSFVTREA